MPPKRNVSKPYAPATDQNLMADRQGGTLDEKDRLTAIRYLRDMGLKREAPNEDRVVPASPRGMVTRAGEEPPALDTTDPPDFRTAVVEPMMAIVGGLEAGATAQAPAEPTGFTPTFPMSMQPGSPTLMGVMDQSCDALCAEYNNAEYAPLAVLLVALRGVAWLHQAAHWQSQGDPFYGDHQLFERLYHAVNGEVDAVAERVVGLGTADLVDPARQASQLGTVLSWCCAEGTLGQVPASALAQRSLKAERLLLELVGCVTERLRQGNLLTPGLENRLAGVADTHETHVYLLRQRCSAR